MTSTSLRSEKNQPARIAWNTGRPYSAQGQRIAAEAVAGGIIMADYDRGIEYFIPDCPLRISAIMERYDANDRTLNYPEAMAIEEFIALRDSLIATAKAFVS
jgi:hypothetical protein